MNPLHNYIKFFTATLLVLQLFMPTYGQAYFFKYFSSIKVKHTGFVCSHDKVNSSRESGDEQQQVAYCHELDVPADVGSGPVSSYYSPLFSRLAPSYKGALLSGHAAVIDIPPEICV
jgi:hypothetical protein